MINKLNYKQLLKEHPELSKPIKHRKHFPRNTRRRIFCPRCGAPFKFLYAFAKVFHQPTNSHHQRFQCKLCSRQFSPTIPQKRPKFLCPHCGHALGLRVRRRTFDVYTCNNKKCRHWISVGLRFKIRAFFSIVNDVKVLNISSRYDMNLGRSSFSPLVHFTALSLHFEYSIPVRDVSRIFGDHFNINVSKTSISDWSLSLAKPLDEATKKIKLPVSDIWIIDETLTGIKIKENGKGPKITRRRKGRKGWFFPVMDSNGHLIGSAFHPYKNEDGATSALKDAFQRTHGIPNVIITDGNEAYAIAINRLFISNGYKVQHYVVKGLFDRYFRPSDKRRGYKNLIERVHGILKSMYRRIRGFKSFESAKAFVTLFRIYYNFIRPNQHFDFKTPAEKLIGLILQRGNRWAQLLNINI